MVIEGLYIKGWYIKFYP